MNCSRIAVLLVTSLVSVSAMANDAHYFINYSVAEYSKNTPAVAGDRRAKEIWNRFANPDAACKWTKEFKKNKATEDEIAKFVGQDCAGNQECVKAEVASFQKGFKVNCLFQFPCSVSKANIPAQLLLFEITVRGYAKVAEEWMLPDEENDLSATTEIQHFGERVRTCGWLSDN